MGAGRPILYYGTPENHEVVGSAGRPFEFEGPTALEQVIESVVGDGQGLSDLARRSEERVSERYTWTGVTDAYEELLRDLC